MRIALVTGTVGIGKSATGYALAERAASQGRSAAFLDVDELSRLWPAPAGDPFNDDHILRNLASLVGNFAAAGAELLVLAWHLDRAPELVAIQNRGLKPPIIDASGSISDTADTILTLLI